MQITSASLAAAVADAAERLAREPAAAARAAEAVLSHRPEDPRARLILASARRRLGDTASALGILAPLAKAHPNAPLTQYELGLALAAAGDASAAVAALRRATALNPDLAEGWRALGDLLFAAGDIAAADAAFAQHARAAVTDPALKPIAAAIHAGRFPEAETALRRHRATRPKDAPAAKMLGELLLRAGRHAEAEAELADALALAPDLEGARFAYAEALFRQQKGVDALPQAEALAAAAPDDPAVRNLLAACLGLVGDEPRAILVYESLVADFPRQPRLWLNYGHALRTVGRRDEAVAAYTRCIQLAPALGEAYWGLANLKIAAVQDAHVEAMRRLAEAQAASPADRIHLHYALGKALEDRGEDAEAFRHYAAGAALRRAEGGYDPAALSTLVARTMTVATPAFFAGRPDVGAPDPDPIFVVGLPRSGSTLVEQILASHPAIEGAMELPDIGLIARGLAAQGGSYPEALTALTPDDCAALGRLYLDRTRAHRRLGRPRFVDKMPNNFQHLALIQLILPHATIVDVRRHPLGCGFSAFKQHFAQGQAFSYDLADLGRYYRDYLAMMRHVQAVLPGRVHRVIYEDLVADTEGEVRRLLAACNLPFDPACLDFHRNARAVRTVSSEQVRQPIYREGLDQWRRFESWLAPLKAALGDDLEDWRD